MKVTPQERLKRKMQAQLSKTCMSGFKNWFYYYLIHFVCMLVKYDKKKEKEKAEAKETEELVSNGFI